MGHAVIRSNLRAKILPQQIKRDTILRNCQSVPVNQQNTIIAKQ